MYILMIIISIIIASYSQVILKKGANKKNIYINKYTIIGYSLMVISTIFTLIGYKGVDLTLGGILQSLSFFFVPVFSYIFLKEKIEKKTIIGLCIIIVGFIVYAL